MASIIMRSLEDFFENSLYASNVEASLVILFIIKPEQLLSDVKQ